MQMFSALMEGSPQFREEKARERDANTPRFRSWEDVMMAFSAGLMPLVCRGKPDRLADYMMFLHLVSIEYAKGKHHWPVLLHYIEQRRRAELVADAPRDNPVAAAKRESHRLSSHTTEGGIGLDRTVLGEAAIAWMSRNLVLLEDYLDVDVFRALQSQPTAAEAAMASRHQPQQSHSVAGSMASSMASSFPPLQVSPPAPRYQQPTTPSTSPSSATRPSRSMKPIRNLPPGVSAEMADKIRMARPPHNACLNFLSGRCVVTEGQPCPRGFVHLSLDEINKRIMNREIQ